MPKSQTNKTIPEPEIGGSGIASSSESTQGGGSIASPAELALALEASQKRIAELEREAKAHKSGDDQISQLVQALTANLKQPAPIPTTTPNPENLNKSTSFQNTVDGTGMIEAQQTCARFKAEEVLPISIPKTTAGYVGSSLSVTVNGVRVSIPCDGKTYFINKTHWEHARERLAKLDLLNSQEPKHIVEIGE